MFVTYFDIENINALQTIACKEITRFNVMCELMSCERYITNLKINYLKATSVVRGQRGGYKRSCTVSQNALRNTSGQINTRVIAFVFCLWVAARLYRLYIQAHPLPCNTGICAALCVSLRVDETYVSVSYIAQSVGLFDGGKRVINL